jgi:ubiquinone/menaquinone biosynthesis C-methylase UbiE
VDKTAENEYKNAHSIHWDAVWTSGHNSPFSQAYHKRLAQIFKFLVPEGSHVLEIGCGKGDLLAALQPSKGVGIDLSSEAVTQAAQKYPDLTFLASDALDLGVLVGQQFDAIILSDLINDLWDVQTVFEQIQLLCSPSTRLIINFYSRMWQFPLQAAQIFGLAKPVLEQNWLTVPDVRNLLDLAGFETIRSWQEILFPVPILSSFFDQFLVKIFPFNQLALANFLIARPARRCFATITGEYEHTVSVIVPARNEAGNIPQIFDRVPQMGAGTELIFVEGNSSDDTYRAIEEEMQVRQQANVKLFKQEGKGKGDAVRKGFENASGDILMILDADLTVPPEDLPRFYKAINSGLGEFVNGVRLVYPMEKQAMRFLNMLGNKFFSLAFSWLLGQPLKDTLCGTKVLWRDDYRIIAANRLYFGEFDPFGDYDLIFGAAKQNRKIVDLPIRYRERTYGTTNIDRWKHGWLLIRMVIFAARRLKFI